MTLNKQSYTKLKNIKHDDVWLLACAGIKPSANVIVAHPDFRMIVLANRPGFPFLGNDFFGAMGEYLNNGRRCMD